MAHSQSRFVLIWLAMCALTLASFWTGESHLPGNLPAIAVIVVALIKVRFVILEFMEVRTAPVALRLGLETWVVLLGAVLVAMLV
jgi:heme/copper-type cytochrome/quinol oxidase subunit 4